MFWLSEVNLGGDLAEFGKTSRERPKSALYLRFKIVKGGPFRDIKKIPEKIFR